MLRPVERHSLSAEVFTQLRDHILGGALEPGAALPAERALAEQLGVNRAAVREGLKRLEQAGLVRIQQGGATRVLDYRRTAGLEVLAALMVQDGRIDTAVARGVLELRTELAPMVARLAVARADEDDLDAIDATVEAMRAADGDVAALQVHALDFWAAMVAGTKNVALSLALNSLTATYSEVMAHFTQILASEVGATDAYAEVAAAVRAREREAAEAGASAIVRRGAEAIEGLLAAVDAAQGAAR